MRAILLVIDGFGMGALPDAAAYNDEGADTALHVCERTEDLNWPTLKALGLGNAAGLLGKSLPGCEAVVQPRASFGLLAAMSPGKDSTTGHWELAGIQLRKPFSTFPPLFPSFPQNLIDELERGIGRRMIGNVSASGTDIIRDLGDRHIESGDLILYTSADSVLQIAAHESVLPPERLYTACKAARKIADRYNIARVIARPFSGKSGAYVRTNGRKDFSIDLPEPSILDALLEAGTTTIGIGKIGDLFNGQGLSVNIPVKGNPACLNTLAEIVASEPGRNTFIFVNLVDTDMLYGHRRDIPGFYRSVANTDTAIASIMDHLAAEDILIISADHGCDPAYIGSDHTREYIPLLLYGSGRHGRNLGVRKTFSDCAQSIAAFFGIAPILRGTSFL
jgi:phosphopentomutase